MLRNYIILTLRNLSKRKAYSFINVFGLAIGISVCLVIWNYMEFELSYDRFYQHAENIYRATFTEYGKDWKDDWYAEFGYGLGPALAEEIPEIKNVVRTHPVYDDAAIISYQNKSGQQQVFHETNILFADPSFLRVFTFKIIHGNIQQALLPSSIVLTESAARRFFGKREDVIGKTLHLETKDWVDGDFIVTAVIEDVPQNSHLHFDMLLPMHDLLQIEYYRYPQADWTEINFTTYIELNEGVDPLSLTGKTKAFMDKHTGTEPLGVRLAYQPIQEINLSPDLNKLNAHRDNLYFFGLLSLFILSIAWVNYINLSTARATERSKEVGIKKAMGVTRRQLIIQFIVESVVINLMSIVFALLLAIVLLPILSRIIGKEIVFDYFNPLLWLVLAAVFISGAVLAGAYPAFVLSSFKTTEVIKGKMSRSSWLGVSLRKGLVVFQFAASLFLIAGTFIIVRQISFMKDHDKGLNMSRMLVVTGPQIIGKDESSLRMTSFKNGLLRLTAVTRVTTSGAVPGSGYSFSTGMEVVGRENEKAAKETIHAVWVDTDFIETYGFQILSGKVWNPESNYGMSVFINEAALRKFGLGTAEDALGERLSIHGSEPFTIQGVVKDFHWNTLQSGFEPMVFRPQPVNYNLFSIQLTNDLPSSIQQIEKLYKEYFPGNPFVYYFLDDFFNSQYHDEKQFEDIFSLFSALAVIIACLGLAGLAAFTTMQRLKEISIRKILGASVVSIMTLLTTQFITLLVISFFIAIPVAWYAADFWLNNFAFRINVGADFFIIPFLLLMTLALITISVQIFYGANADPAKVLRNGG